MTYPEYATEAFAKSDCHADIERFRFKSSSGSRRNTLCISRDSLSRVGTKDPIFCGQDDLKIPPFKKGAGRILHSPRCSSRFAYERDSSCGFTHGAH